ncbi:MAG: ThiF family adenylyltransferase [Nitrospirae bacterium]|nr:ThiF family adenylyltransferase [Nitrospirota bacterium]
MSQQPINHSPDLKRLQDEGFEVEIRAGYLLINGVPYLNSNKEIKAGTLVSELTLTGNKTTKPNTHVVFFKGDYPCHRNGSSIEQIRHNSNQQPLTDDLVINHSFSNKPSNGYSDYYEKMTRYIDIISAPAQSVDSSVTAKTFKVIESEDEESVFNYIDTSSSRAGITIIADKLKIGKVGIVGLGGTGSYVLDLVAKTPVQEIHLFDGDKFFQHNAFRSPGAPSLNELKKAQSKVAYFSELYSKMRKKIIPHEFYINSSKIDVLRVVDFAFICLDKGNVKEIIIDKLEKLGISFIDVGMGVEIVDEALIGILRVTTSTENKREHVKGKNRISFSDGDGNDDYSRNIQIADLNALNAALAVIKWKKLFGFYQDCEKEHHSTYTLNVNMLTGDDQL